MTLKQWLAEQRRPEMCGINARAYLKTLGATHMKGDRTCALNAVKAAIREMCKALEAARTN